MRGYDPFPLRQLKHWSWGNVVRVLPMTMILSPCPSLSAASTRSSPDNSSEDEYMSRRKASEGGGGGVGIEGGDDESLLLLSPWSSGRAENAWIWRRRPSMATPLCPSGYPKKTSIGR